MTNIFDVGGVAVSGNHFINNERVTSDQTFETRSPLNWEIVLGNVARGDKATADAAVTAAQNAFPAWAALTAAERAVHLNRLADCPLYTSDAADELH